MPETAFQIAAPEQVGRPRITVQGVVNAVARYYVMTPAQLLERTRRQKIAHPRQVAMYLATKLTNASLPDIGRRFGGYDHTTVIYARDQVEGRMAKSEGLTRDVAILERQLRGSAQ